MSPAFVTALIVAGRFLLGANFVYWGVLNVQNFAAIDPLIAAKGFPQPWFVLRLAVAVEIIAGVMLALSILPALGAFALAIFTIVVTPVFHPFWQLAGEERKTQIGNVVTNASIVGALLLAVATG